MDALFTLLNCARIQTDKRKCEVIATIGVAQKVRDYDLK